MNFYELGQQATKQAAGNWMNRPGGLFGPAKTSVPGIAEGAPAPKPANKLSVGDSRAAIAPSGSNIYSMSGSTRPRTSSWSY